MSRIKTLTGEVFSYRLLNMEKQMIYLKEKLGTWCRVAEVLDITPRYCMMIAKNGKVGRHLERIIRQKVELYR